jgi:hypothetical protein
MWKSGLPFEIKTVPEDAGWIFHDPAALQHIFRLPFRRSGLDSTR